MDEQIISKHEQGIFFEHGTEPEIANMLNGFSALGHKNHDVISILHSYLTGPDFLETGELS